VESDIESRQTLRVAVWSRLHGLPSLLSQGADCLGSQALFSDSSYCLELESKPDFVDIFNFVFIQLLSYEASITQPAWQTVSRNLQVFASRTAAHTEFGT
jgi:hypothetical protein